MYCVTSVCFADGSDMIYQIQFNIREASSWQSYTVFICILIHSSSKVKYTCDEGYDEVHIHIVKFADLGVAAMQGWTSLFLSFL